MTGPGFGEVLSVVFAILTPAFLLFYFAKRYFSLKERKLEIEALNAAEKAAQYVAHSSEIEKRLATIERIVTDGPLRLSNEIDALAIAYQAQPKKDVA